MSMSFCLAGLHRVMQDAECGCIVSVKSLKMLKWVADRRDAFQHVLLPVMHAHVEVTAALDSKHLFDGHNIKHTCACTCAKLQCYLSFNLHLPSCNFIPLAPLLEADTRKGMRQKVNRRACKECLWTTKPFCLCVFSSSYIILRITGGAL
ncbi:hypothetical protein DUNSADRAFT_9979 [Dunaliella salina]|uniref:Uncharacterized protein n=1 Tax=Dunaliella salina TaxID=3046 RepID=A0ABQ7GGE1_DUNSA|nr:hypothetical protein DUNSADRAFT_9979 [Dunaliella salina]|eukprot:KAF5833669.1 hypothetical protein DUNSADRAFT_9979 [Dunaliella salina]